VLSDDESNSQEFKKLKKENINYQETINRIVDHIINQPGLMKVLGWTEEANERI
jgi:hypothetical protein